MKRAITIIVFLLLFASSQAIHFIPKYAVGISVMPTFGLGVNFTSFQSRIGLYGSYTHSMRKWTLDKFDSSHKISAGLLCTGFGGNRSFPGYLSVGYSYNIISGMQPAYEKNKWATQKGDIQFGCGLIMDKIIVGIRYDILKNDSSVDIKFSIGKKRIKY